jgi:plastocyanin
MAKRRGAVFAAAVLAAGLGVTLLGQGVAEAATKVSIVDNGDPAGPKGFEPRKIKVDVGTKVKWINVGLLPHTVTRVGGGFDSGVLVPGDKFTKTFNKEKKYNYFCQIHPDMTGVVKVGDPPTGGGGSPPPGGGGYPY